MPALLMAGVLLILGLSSAGAAPAPDYNAVKPILREFCAGCHNDGDLEGEFSVETFRTLMRGGEDGPVVVPGQAAESLILKVLTGRSKPSMPPKGEPKPTAEQISLLEAWISGGARGPVPDQDHSLLSTLEVPEISSRTKALPAITAAAYSHDGKLLALARYADLELRPAVTEQKSRILSGHPGKINAVHFSKDDVWLVAASGIAGLRGEAALWKSATGERVRTFSGKHRDLLYDAEFSPDGSLLATAGYDRRILLWKVDTGEQVRVMEGHNGAIFDLAFNRDGTILASASADETVKLWRVADGERLDTLNQPQAAQFAVAFTPDDQFVAAAGADNRLRLWRLISRAQAAINPLLHARFAHEDDIVAMALSPDGRWLISSSADRTVKLWTMPDLEPAGVMGAQPDVGTALAVQPDSQSFLLGRMDGSSAAWPIQAEANADVKTSALPSQSNPKDEPQTATPAAASETVELSEAEPNGGTAQAQEVKVPSVISGTIGEAGDTDVFRFSSRAGEEWALEVNAARSKSKLDSRIEVLDAEGRPVERMVLQALRDSWFTFRGKDSTTPDDFRLQNWREMELNQYLFANGEVVKLWLYPRGPDSGFKVYPGFGQRHTYFGTTALSHPLGEPCYIVRPLSAGSKPNPNGLPVFHLYHDNDDDPSRRWGADSQLLFTAPADGQYLVRLRDVRGFGGKDFSYKLTVRPRQPDFQVSLEGQNPAISPGSGREFVLKAERLDGFEGAIRVDVEGLPAGFTASTPVVIEAGQNMAIGVVFAATNAAAPPTELAKATRLSASASIGGRQVTHPAGTLGEIKLGERAKVRVEILLDGAARPATAEPGQPLELTIAPGETITARVKASRVEFPGRIEFGTDDSGRNLPHGVYIDNIGLNGLLIVEEETERQFFITAAPWVAETTRSFHLLARADGSQASPWVTLRVRPHRGSP